MVNGTPVLDIKPFIPEYDSPNYVHTDRPLTEGISDAAETMADLSLQNFDSLNTLITSQEQESLSPILSNTQSQRTERGSPDGQEHLPITVATWLNDRVSYKVSFTERSVTRLNELIGDRSVSFRANVECLLSQDPRSNYVRSKYPESEYNCVLEDVSLSCVFDEASKVCSIVAVRSADEMHD